MPQFARNPGPIMLVKGVSLAEGVSAATSVPRSIRRGPHINPGRFVLTSRRTGVVWCTGTSRPTMMRGMISDRISTSS